MQSKYKLSYKTTNISKCSRNTEIRRFLVLNTENTDSGCLDNTKGQLSRTFLHMHPFEKKKKKNQTFFLNL